MSAKRLRGGGELACVRLAWRRKRLVAGVSVAALAVLMPDQIAIVQKAAGIPANAAGVSGFVNGANSLVTPALVAVAAIAPLALIAGGLVLLFGGRRGLQIVGTALGVLLLLGSAKALIA